MKGWTVVEDKQGHQSHAQDEAIRGGPGGTGAGPGQDSGETAAAEGGGNNREREGAGAAMAGEKGASGEAAGFEDHGEDAGSGELKEPPAEEVQAELRRLREEAESWRQRALRMQADFENFRRRTRQEREEWASAAVAGVIEKFLPVLDHLELALKSGQQSTDVGSLLQGVDMVVRQFRDVLEREGVSAIETVGKPFDPNLHEAIAQVSDTEEPPGTVVEEFRKGYRYKDRVLRPAMVKVSGDTGGN